LSMGCIKVQGFGIARPMPAAALPDWAANWHVTCKSPAQVVVAESLKKAPARSLLDEPAK
jgi:hypothetical protein